MKALQDLLKERKLEGYLLTNLSDQVYFTDFRSEGYYGLIGRSEAWLFLPNLLFDQARVVTEGFHCLQGPFFPTLKSVIKKSKLKKMGFDPDQLPFSFGQTLMKSGFLPVPGLVKRLRLIKDAMEIRRLKEANNLAARGAQFIRKRLKPGVSEKQAAADLGHFFHREGDGLSFDLIVAAGPNSAYPHHITSNYKMKAGDPVICDIGGLIEGYHSDLTRTYTLGKIGPSFSRIYKIVEKAQKEGIRRLKPGVTAESVDAASRQVIKRHGYGSRFVHSTGHGVGLDIHEDPRIGPGNKVKLKEGMVVTVEPGIYLPGRFGVRIEDTLLLTKSGSELITK